MRAQWARRPFVWNIYPTDDGAHWIKMAAFLARYAEGLERDQAGALTSLWEAWNRPQDGLATEGTRPSLAQAWADAMGRRGALAEHARRWGDALGARPDLAAQLVDFVDNVL